MKIFQRKQIIFGQLLILLLLFVFSKSDSTTDTETFDIRGPKDFGISVKKGYKYLKLEVQGNDMNTNYVLSVYSDTSKKNRVQLAQSLNGKTLLYHQFKEDDQYIQYTLECDTDSCSGSLHTTFSEKIELSEGNTFSFYVSGTQAWEFLIYSSSSKTNIWARGQKQITTNLRESNVEKYDNFYISSNTMSGTDFTVKGEVGDFINVGCIGFIENSNTELSYESNTKLEVDGPIITGFLKRYNVETVCYPFENKGIGDESETLIFATGTILTKIAYAYIMYNNGKKITDDKKDEIFPSGIIAHVTSVAEVNEQKLCVTFPKEKIFSQFEDIDNIVFTYQLVKETTKKSGINLYEPQIRGVFYPRMTIRDSLTAFTAQSIDSNKINYNVMTMNGFPQMYVVDCNNYPLCPLDDYEKGIRPRIINKFSSYIFDNDEQYSPISLKQKLLVVKCKTGAKGGEYGDESKYFDILCGFGSLMYGNDDKIELLEDLFFNQYALKGQEHNYKIKIAKESKIEKILIDVMTYVGDVEVTIANNDVPYSQYFAINKYYISVKVDEMQGSLDEIDLKVKAKGNTYYTVLYNIGRTNEDDSLITNQLQTGMSYLVTIDTTKLDKHSQANKQVKIRNERSFDLMSVLVNFYSLNCIIDVSHLYTNEITNMTEYELLYSYDYLSQDVRNSSDKGYHEEEYEYRIQVLENDYSQYKGKLCKVYTSAIELTDAHEDDSRDILIPDDTPQQIMFGEKVKHVSYAYVHFDFDNTVLVKFNPKHKAKYKVKIYFENKESTTSESVILANELITLEPSDWEERCKDRTRVCYIQIDITLEETKNVKNPILEFSVKSVHTKPVSYLQKNLLKVDYVQNKQPQYYYTELGVNELCYIVVNFLRGSGKIFSKIVRKDLKEPEEGADWKGKYKLPDETDSVMDPFTKETYFGTFDYECENGCFLLIKVSSDVEGEEIAIDRNYPYSLMVHSREADSDAFETPIISIPTDEYIVGTINVYHPENRIFKIYSVLLDSDADKVVIDFQSDAASLFVSVNEIPSIEGAHFKYWTKGKDSVISFDKSEILDFANKNRDYDKKLKSIENLVLALGIWTNMTDTIYTTPFSFIVRLENGTENDIYRVNSDQKSLCNPRKMKNSDNYRCLYIIEFDYLHNYQSLALYATPEDQSALLSMYAKKVDPYDYEIGTIKDFPTKDNNEYSSKTDFTDFLFVEQMTKDNYVLVSVESNKDTPIEFYSCVTLYQNGMTPNPSSSQLYAALTDFKTTLNFPSEFMVMVNLVGIFGGAKLHWEGDDNVYYLKGRDDRLSITSSRSERPHNLIIEINIPSGENGFLFYLNYNIRVDNANIDALNLYKSVNYVYTDNDLPIVYYAPLSTFTMENRDYYEIFFTFDDLENENKKDLTFYDTVPFDVNAYIVKENSVYEYRLFPYISIDSTVRIKGVYDQAIRTGIVRVSKSDIESSDIPSYERPYLYLSIDKTDEFKTIRKYKKIGVETTVLRSNSDISVSELSNQFGLIKKDEKKKYVLKTDNKLKYMNLHFSCVEDNLSISIEGRNDLKKGKTIFGKTFYSLAMNDNIPELLNLIIENKKDSDEYFMFQYTFSDKDFNDDKYRIANTKITAKKTVNSDNELDFSVSLSPVENSDKFNVTYIIRLINGKKPKNPDVSLKVDSQVVKEYYNPKSENGKLELSVVKVTKDVNYIQVIAQIRDKEVVEYLSYDLSEELETDPNKNKENKIALIVVIVVGVLLFIVVVVLVIIIIIFNNKNKDLLDKVNKVSFADAGDKDDDNDLLSPVN